MGNGSEPGIVSGSYDYRLHGEGLSCREASTLAHIAGGEEQIAGLVAGAHRHQGGAGQLGRLLAGQGEGVGPGPGQFADVDLVAAGQGDRPQVEMDVEGGEEGGLGERGHEWVPGCMVGTRGYIFGMGKATSESTLFRTGGSLAVRIPKAWALGKAGDRVRLHKRGKQVVLERADEWSPEFLAALGSCKDLPLLERPRRSSLREEFRKVL